MTKPVIIIVGADKGGVGKTTIARALVDHLDAAGMACRIFDTENEVTGGVLKRFYPDRAEIVDLADSDGQMRVFDTLNPANVTVIDIRAGLLSPTLQLLADIGFLDPDKYTILVLHVLDANQASIDEIAPVAARLGAGARHVIVGNRRSATKFAFPPGALDIPMLSAAAAEAVDKANQPFGVFAKDNASAVMRGMVRTWLDRVLAQFKAAKLP
ncbi:hypothetical protein [Rhodopseudomonas sp. BR0G17]|uniref:hypothetical protein n=1 Tax=Rhodopseudomonas sp. BR0G17 TaxID=2269368 RepID=UPI0013E0A007|nr:hypothetical protein [Rhodopseudomonas sp. BR0G17]NEW96634.1 hypothetical protein [Rhodopseudomonas sp. BR0G17]